MDLMECFTGDSPSSDVFYTAIMRDCYANRMLVFNRDVDGDLIEDFILHIIQWNREDKGLKPEDRKPITILINSQGGDLILSFALIDICTNSQTPIRTVCVGTAASAAYLIFLCGDERVAFPNSVLLQHDGAIEISNSSSKAKDTMRFIDDLDARTKQYVLSHTKMTEEWYDDHYNKEYFMYANDEGRKFGCVDKIIGEDCGLEVQF